MKENKQNKLNRINLLQELKKPFLILVLDKKVMNEVADNSPTWLAVLFFGLWSLIAGIISQDYMTAIGWFLEAVLLTWIIVLIFYLSGLMFRSRGEFAEIYKPLGYAYLVVGISFFVNKLYPNYVAMLISVLLQLWSLVIAYKIIMVECRLKQLRSLIVVLVPVILLMIMMIAQSLVLLNIVLKSGLVNSFLF